MLIFVVLEKTRLFSVNVKMARTEGAKDRVRRKFVHSFARQYLQDYNIAMYADKKRILGPVGERIYQIRLPNTRYYMGEQFIPQGETQRITKFEELRDLGFVIVSVSLPADAKWFTGQKVKYELRRVQDTGEHIGKIPKDHYVEYDPYNRVARLIGTHAGPMGFGDWLTIERKALVKEGSGRQPEFAKMLQDPDALLTKQFSKWSGVEEEQKPVYIEEVAFMVTDSNEIVCFPNTPDMPSILITGMKGCQIGTDTILMSDGSFKAIKDIKIGDRVISPQEDGTMTFANVTGTTSWQCDEMYEIRELNRQKRILYTCSYNHLIPLNKHIVPRVDGVKRIDLTYMGIRHNIAKDYAKFSSGVKQQHTTLLSPQIDKFEGRANPIIDPYVLGYFLGDGCFTSTLSITINIEDVEALEYLSKFNHLPLRRKFNHYMLAYSLKSDIAKHLTGLGLRWKKSGTKFIPPEALYADIDYRKALLAGIIDSDGYCDKSGCYDIILKSKLLIEGIAMLVSSIGGRHGPIKQKIKYCTNTKSGRKKGYYWGMSFYFGDIKLPIKNERKQKRTHSVYLSPNRLSVDAVKSIPAVVYGFEIDSESKWYITNDYVVTHNSGKSFSLHSLVSRFFWKPAFDYKICVMNDSSRETGTWCLPNNDIDQINTLKRLNERPLPLPCVYLHPLVKEEYEKLYIGDVGFDVTIPFREIVDNHKEYLNLGDSARYFTQISDELRDCTSEVQVKGIFDDLSLHYNVPPPSANKIRAEFDTIFDSKMTDISTHGQAPWRTTRNEMRHYNPMTACVHAGVLPILETEFVSNYKQLLSIYFRYFVGDLFNRQKQDPDFLAEQSELLIVVDEAHNISQKSLRTGADMLMRRCVREGRPRRIGTLLATQKFNELPDVIKDNSTYLVMFKNPGEAQEIASQYNLGKHMASQIKDLGKHECIAYSTEYFIVYDSYGNKRKSKLNETFKGRTLPPYSMHKRPKTEEGGE